MQKKYIKRICIALLVILVANVFAWGLQTSFHKVRVRDMYLVTSQQQQLHALAFIPRNASSENKLPCVVTGHGGFHSAEMQDAACIELSRRGFVVIAVDMYSHGMSSNVPQNMVGSIFMGNGMGIGDMVDYVMDGNMDFIDRSRVGIMGHSMGTLACSAVITNYATQYEAAIAAASLPDSDGGIEITEAEQTAADGLVEIKAAFCEGMSPSTLTGTWDKIHGINIAFEYGIYEELNSSNSTGDGHLLEAPEALEMINAVDPSVTKIVSGQYYGSKDDGTLRVFYQPNTTHLTDFIAPSVTAEFISFFTDVFGVNTTLAPTNQVYFIKQLFNFAAFIALFCLVVPFGDMCLSAPALSGIRGTASAPHTAGKKKFWLGWGLGAVFSIIGFFVSNTIDTKAIIFKPGPMSNATLFPINEANIVMVWMLIFALWNLVWFYICMKQEIKDGADVTDMIGLKTGWKQFWNTVAAAAAIIALVYMLVWFSKWMFNVDFRFWKVAVKQFNNEKLIYFLQYFPVWFLFMLSASLLTNGPWRVDGEGEGKNLALIGLGFALGGIIIWCLQYGTLFITGAPLWSNMNGVASIALRNWVLFLAPFMLRSFYRMTGKNWLGPITLSVLFTLISVSTTTVQNYML